MLWYEFARAYTQYGTSAIGKKWEDVHCSPAQWAGITNCYAGPEFDAIPGCDGPDRHRIFIEWAFEHLHSIPNTNGAEVLQKYVTAEIERRAKLRRQAADLRAQAILLDMEAES